MSINVKTNDSRLINHLSKIFNVRSEVGRLTSLLNTIDLTCDLPFVFSDVLVVYETFPVFGELMFPKPKSHLWQLLESTDASMLLTDSMLNGKESLFICRNISTNSFSSDINNILSYQLNPSICVNTYKGVQAIAYPLISLRGV